MRRSDLQGTDDSELIACAAQGDREAFGALYERYVFRVFRHVYYLTSDPHTAEDLTAQTFLNALEAIPRYEVRGVPFLAWLLRIAYNLTVNYRKVRKNGTAPDPGAGSLLPLAPPAAIYLVGAPPRHERRPRMAVRVGINGFGRIGRQVFKAIHDFHPDALQVVAVNDLTDPRTNAHLLKYDSTYGAFPGDIRASDDTITVDGQSISVLAQRDPAQIPWRDFGVEIVVESTGLFTAGGEARAHLERGGAKKGGITAPPPGEDPTA